jgi:U2 small nuclear ribonucleoprotein A'
MLACSRPPALQDPSQRAAGLQAALSPPSAQRQPHTRTAPHPAAPCPDAPAPPAAQEREAAKALGDKAAQANGAAAANTFEPDEDLAAVQQQQQEEEVEGEQPDAMEAEQQAAAAGGPAKLTADQTAALQAAIANVQTLEEVRRIEEALKSGYMPSGFEFEADGAAASSGGAEGGNGAAPMDQG